MLLWYLLLPLNYFLYTLYGITCMCGVPVSCGKDTYISVLLCPEGFGTIPGPWHNLLWAARCSTHLFLLRACFMTGRCRTDSDHTVYFGENQNQEIDVKPHVSILTLQTPRQVANWLAWPTEHMLHSSRHTVPDTEHSLDQCCLEPSVMMEMGCLPLDVASEQMKCEHK